MLFIIVQLSLKIMTLEQQITCIRDSADAAEKSELKTVGHSSYHSTGRDALHTICGCTALPFGRAKRNNVAGSYTRYTADCRPAATDGHNSPVQKLKKPCGIS